MLRLKLLDFGFSCKLSVHPHLPANKQRRKKERKKEKRDRKKGKSKRKKYQQVCIRMTRIGWCGVRQFNPPPCDAAHSLFGAKGLISSSHLCCVPSSMFSSFTTQLCYFLFHSKPRKQGKLPYLLVIQKMLLMEISESDLLPLSPVRGNLKELVIRYF